MFSGPKPFNQINFSGMPNMAGTLVGWFQPLVFGVVVKEYINYEVVETMTEVNFRGVWQPLETRKLLLKPENQRSWTWIQCHAHTNLHLENDSVIKFRGVQYRVMAQWDYSLNGFYEYHLVEDYTGSGPAINPEVP